MIFVFCGGLKSLLVVWFAGPFPYSTLAPNLSLWLSGHLTISV